MCVSYVCVSVLDREASWVFASTALEVIWMAVHLASYSDLLSNWFL